MYKPNDYTLKLTPGKIAIQGQIGSFSHATLRSIFGDVATGNILFFDNFNDPFLAVEEGRARTAVIPIKNTIAGLVPEVPPLIRKHKLQIMGEYFTPIEMCLMGLPRTRLHDLKYVSSHPMALKQCNKFLSQPQCRDISRIVAADTGGSAAKIAQDKRKEYGAIASAAAADAYGLEIIERGIEDIPGTVTRFIVLQQDYRRATARETDILYPRENGREYITSLILKPKRNDHWALAKALDHFRDNKIHHSFPSEYVGPNFRTDGFLIDLSGHVNDGAIQTALDNMRVKSNGVGCVTALDVMGVYPAHHTQRFGREFNIN